MYVISSETTTNNSPPSCACKLVCMYPSSSSTTAAVSSTSTAPISLRACPWAAAFFFLLVHSTTPISADTNLLVCTGYATHVRDNVGLSYAWNLYLNHPDNHKVNFTLLLQPGYWFPTALKGGNETLTQEIDRY